MPDDPYAILGLTKTATDEAIKKAYRKLVRTNHPDLNPDDPTAEARFKAISAAHDLLKDPATRARFDAGEIDATGAERPPRQYYRDFTGGGPQPDADMGGIFAEMFRRRGQGFSPFEAHGEDLRFTLEVPFLDAANGAKTRITLPGIGPIEVQIPPGSSHDQTLRLRGKGAGTPPGDALITLIVADHPHFTRDGDIIHLTLPITLDEAVLGAKVQVPTIAGPVNLAIPAGATTGQTLRLRGRGIARPKGTSGDQLVHLTIAMPPTIDDDLRGFFETWRKTHAYSPRRGLNTEATS